MISFDIGKVLSTVAVLLALLALPAVAQQPGDAAPVEFTEPDEADGPAPADSASPTVVDAPALEPGSPAVAEGEPAAGTGQDGRPQGYVTYKTPWEVYLTGLAIVLLLGTLTVLTALAWRSGLTPDFIRAFILVTVIFAALFLIAAGYSDEQAAPVYGLLGTVLGYLFGKGDTPREARSQPAPSPETGGEKPKGP